MRTVLFFNQPGSEQHGSRIRIHGFCPCSVLSRALQPLWTAPDQELIDLSLRQFGEQQCRSVEGDCLSSSAIAASGTFVIGAQDLGGFYMERVRRGRNLFLRRAAIQMERARYRAEECARHDRSIAPRVLGFEFAELLPRGKVRQNSIQKKPRPGTVHLHLERVRSAQASARFGG